MQLGSSVAMAVAKAGSCNANLTLSLVTSRCSPKRQKKIFLIDKVEEGGRREKQRDADEKDSAHCCWL